MEQDTHELVIHTDHNVFVSTTGTEERITQYCNDAVGRAGTVEWLGVPTPDGIVYIASRSVVAIEVRATDYLDT